MTTQPTWTIYDFIPSAYWPAIRDGSIGDTDLTAYLQEWIEAAPNSTLLRAPAGTFPCVDVRPDGVNGDKRGLHFKGAGRTSTIFRKPSHASLTTGTKRAANTWRTMAGRDFLFEDMRLEGNRDRGGVAPPFALPWEAGFAYTVAAHGSVTFSTKADGTEVVPGERDDLALANGGRMFRILQNHTSSADIDTDLAAGRVQEVTAQVWSWDTLTGYWGDWEIDDSYDGLHAFYLHGRNAAITDCRFRNVDFAYGVYGGDVFGSGPLFASLVGSGADRNVTVNCRGIENGGSNFGGGNNRSCTHVRPTTIGGFSSGLRFDSGSHDSVMIFPEVLDGENLDNAGILFYDSDRCKVIRPSIEGPTTAVWIVDCANYEAILVASELNGGLFTVSNSTASATQLPYIGGVA